MSIEMMITEAVLRDRFTPVLRRIASEQDTFGRKTMAMNAAGNIFLGMGTAAAGFLVKSVKVSGQLDEIKKTMIAVEGANKAAFDFDFALKYAQASKYSFLENAEAAALMARQGQSVKDNLADIGDIAAATGRPLAQIANLYDRLKAGGQVGFVLGQGGFPRLGISTKDVFEAAGLPYRPGQKIYGSITADQAWEAIKKIKSRKGWDGIDAKLSTTTLSGATSMIGDAVTHVENNLGAGKLPVTIRLLNEAAGATNGLADAIKNVPGAGDTFALTAGGLIAAGGLAKGIMAWKSYKAAIATASAVAAIERKGEVDKVGIAKAEGDAVQGAAGKYGGLTAKLEGVAAKAGIVNATALRGIGVLGLYGVALVGLAADAYLVVKTLKELGDASENVEKAQQANRDAIKMGYDVKQSHVTGGGSKSIWKQYGYELSQSPLVNPLIGAGIKALWGKDFDAPTGFTALTDEKTRAAAKAHGMPKGGVRAQQIAAEKAAKQAERDRAAKMAREAREMAGTAANKYQLDPALDYKLKQDERRVTLLEAQKAGQDKINAARKTEIADLEKAEKLLRAQAKIATDPKAKYKLLDEADEDAQKAKLLALDKKKGDKGGFDKTAATILGAAGLGEDEVLKRTGIGRKFFASMGKGSLPPDPLKAALAKIGKQDIHVTLNLDGKAVQTITVKVENEVAKVLAQVLGGSNKRLLPTN